MTYRIQSTDPADARTLARFAPHDLPIRTACGVSLDIARHLLGEPRIVSSDGHRCVAIVEAEMEQLRRHRAGLAPAEG
jgi:hypothetical protein